MDLLEKIYYKSKTGVLFCSDHLDILPELKSCSVDMMITSPPYDDNRTYHGYSFDYKKLGQQLYRVLKIGGVLVWIVNDMNEKGTGSEGLTSCEQKIYFRKKIGFVIHDTMIWEKVGFSAPGNVRYHQAFEYMIIFSKGAPKCWNPIKDRKNKNKRPFGRNTRRQKDGSIRNVKAGEKRLHYDEYGMRTNVWTIKTAAQENPCKKIKHPARFSKKLCRDHITTWTDPGDIVMDPMCGSGTALLIAEKMNRQWMGIEVSPEYCEESKIVMQREKYRKRQLSIEPEDLSSE